MLKHIPFIKLFSVHFKYYLYDTNTNAIFKIPKEIYLYLESLNNENFEKSFNNLSDKHKKFVNNMLVNGILKPIPTYRKIEHFETERLDYFFQDNMRSVTLQVTQNCNLRCHYCVYSGSYVNRTHNNKRMSWETAKKSIDYLFEHSSLSKNVSIGFYGGEPLLEWDLIVKCVEYAESLFFEKKINFLMTSNITLLEDYMIDFICKHNINLTISLDGPKDIQNANRVFANGNEDTFSVVMRKIKLFEELNAEYLKRNVAFNAVIDLDKDVNASNEFFFNYDIIKDIQVSGNVVNQDNKTETSLAIPQYYSEMQYELFKSYIFFHTDILSNFSPRLYVNDINALKRTQDDRIVVDDSYRSSIVATGQCLPGILRFFVTADGQFYPCERVNEQSPDLCIGNVYDGIDIENAKKILNVSKLTETYCLKCWCFKNCGQCIAKSMNADGHLGADARLKNCVNSKKQAIEKMKDYVILKEYGFDFINLERKHLYE